MRHADRSGEAHVSRLLERVAGGGVWIRWIGKRVAQRLGHAPGQVRGEQVMLPKCHPRTILMCPPNVVEGGGLPSVNRRLDLGRRKVVDHHGVRLGERGRTRQEQCDDDKQMPHDSPLLQHSNTSRIGGPSDDRS